MEDASLDSQGESPAPCRKYSLWAVAAIFIVPALGSLNFGYDIGATSYAIVQMQSTLLSGTDWWETVAKSSFLRGAILSFASAGAFVGSSLAFLFSDRLGRKRELQIGSILYLLGAGLEVCSGTMMTKSTSAVAIAILLCGRIVYGVGIGITMHGAPTYISEMAPPEIRGLLVSLKEAFIVLGLLLGYSVGYSVRNIIGGWPIIYAMTFVGSALVLVLSLFIPRSSRWLILQGLNDEALSSIEFVYRTDYSRDVYDDIVQQSQSRTTGPGSVRKTVWDRSYRAPLIAGLGLVVLQQVTGQPTVLSYAVTIFENAGLSGYTSIFVATLKLAATFVAVFTVETYGRRTLLLTGCSLMLVSLSFLSIEYNAEGTQAASLIVFAMFIYIGGYQFGFGPVTWLLTSEIYPLAIRGQAVALSVQLNFLLNAVVQFIVPILEKTLGLRWTFACFAAMTVYSIYFIFFSVPETKGKTLEEIEQLFDDPQNQSRDAEQPLLEDHSDPINEERDC